MSSAHSVWRGGHRRCGSASFVRNPTGRAHRPGCPDVVGQPAPTRIHSPCKPEPGAADASCRSSAPPATTHPWSRRPLSCATASFAPVAARLSTSRKSSANSPRVKRWLRAANATASTRAPARPGAKPDPSVHSPRNPGGFCFARRPVGSSPHVSSLALSTHSPAPRGQGLFPILVNGRLLPWKGSSFSLPA
jgi:hypothetical protein